MLYKKIQNLYLKLFIFFIFLMSFLSLGFFASVADVTYAQNIPPNTPFKMDSVPESEVQIIKFSEVLSNRSKFTKIAIDSNPNSALIRKGMDYILSSQNSDGSWGTSTSAKFVTTVAVLDALQAFDTTDPKDPKISKGLEWLSYYFTDNNDYLAQKLNTVIAGGEATTSVYTLLNGFDDENGGFVFDRGYESDTLTTARAIRTLNFAGYKDTGINKDLTQSLAVRYLISAKKLDNTWSVFSSGVSSIPVTSEVIESLSLWKDWSLGGVLVNNTLNPAISALKAGQSSNGSWGNDILNTAFAYHAIKFSNDKPTYDLKAVDYFSNAQGANGSWNNNLYKTAKVLSALSLSTNSGNFIIKDIIPTLPLQTGQDATITIKIFNPGDVAISDGALRIIADGYLLSSLDLRTNNISIQPRVNADLIVSLTNTRRFIGNVNFKILYEREGSVSYLGSRYVEQLTFLPDPARRPGLPMYFAVYKNVATNGTPAITWSWPQKSDPYLRSAVVMWRKINTINWNLRAVSSSTVVSATVADLIEGETYEATLGTADVNGSTYFSSPGIQIKTSSSTATYTRGTITGALKSLEGMVTGVRVTGVNSSVTSGSNGTYSQTNLPWGANLVKVSDPLYESFIRRSTLTDNALTSIDLYANKKPELDITQFFVEGGGDINGTRFVKEKGDQADFYVTIKNQNQAITDSSRLDFYVDNVVVKSCNLPSLAKLETKTITCGTWMTWGSTIGTHSIKVVLDSTNVLEEISEANNSLTKTLEIIPADNSPKKLPQPETFEQ